MTPEEKNGLAGLIMHILLNQVLILTALSALTPSDELNKRMADRAREVSDQIREVTKELK